MCKEHLGRLLLSGQGEQSWCSLVALGLDAEHLRQLLYKGIYREPQAKWHVRGTRPEGITLHHSPGLVVQHADQCPGAQALAHQPFGQPREAEAGCRRVCNGLQIVELKT
ncbi:hypothetical protein D9M68_826760 [compost metagenome]